MQNKCFKAVGGVVKTTDDGRNKKKKMKKKEALKNQKSNFKEETLSINFNLAQFAFGAVSRVIIVYL